MTKRKRESSNGGRARRSPRQVGPLGICHILHDSCILRHYGHVGGMLPGIRGYSVFCKWSHGWQVLRGPCPNASLVMAGRTSCGGLATRP
jgi:hypothetical protein